MVVNLLKAKTDFSRLIRLLESGKEESIIVSKYGRPVAKIYPYDKVPIENRIGIAKGMLTYPDDIHDFDEEIEELFEESSL